MSIELRHMLADFAVDLILMVLILMIGYVPKSEHYCF